MMANISELTPGTLERKGIAYAPRTLASLVYMDDGTTLADNIEELMIDGKRFLMKTATRQLQVERANQRIYDIPIPVEKYNYEKYPMVLALNGNMVSSSKYRISDNQLILNEDFSASVKKDDILMFIFHYLDIIVEDYGLDAESINDVRFFVSKTEPKCKQTTDVWFDTSLNQVKQFNGEQWEIIVSGTGGTGGQSMASYRHSVTVNSPTNYVSIGIPEFNKNTDILFVYQNSIYLELDQDYALDDSTKIRCLTGQWSSSGEQQVFNFVVLKNVIKGYDGIDGGLLKNNSITKNKLSQDILDLLSNVGTGGVGGGGIADAVDGSDVVQSPEFRLVTDALIKKWNDYELTIKSLQEKIQKFEQLLEQNILTINLPEE